MGKMGAVFRLVAGLTGVLLGIWGSYGAYQTLLTYYYARFIDVLPRFTLMGEIGNWSAVVALLLGAFFLCRFALKSAGRVDLRKAEPSMLS
jgi:uncharacterized YccA/Bax inhibitor family protein